MDPLLVSPIQNRWSPFIKEVAPERRGWVGGGVELKKRWDDRGTDRPKRLGASAWRQLNSEINKRRAYGESACWLAAPADWHAAATWATARTDGTRCRMKNIPPHESIMATKTTRLQAQDPSIDVSVRRFFSTRFEAKGAIDCRSMAHTFRPGE